MLSLTASRGQTNETAKIRNSAKMSRCFFAFVKAFSFFPVYQRLTFYWFYSPITPLLNRFCATPMFLRCISQDPTA